MYALLSNRLLKIFSQFSFFFGRWYSLPFSEQQRTSWFIKIGLQNGKTGKLCRSDVSPEFIFCCVLNTVLLYLMMFILFKYYPKIVSSNSFQRGSEHKTPQKPLELAVISNFNHQRLQGGT